MRIEAVENIKATLKFKYEGLEWNQHSNLSMDSNMDIFTNIDKVKAYCGGFGNDLESTTCWLDAYNYSLTHRLPITEDIYQFITHRVHVIQQGFRDEVGRFEGMNWEAVKPVWDYLSDWVASTLNFIMVHGLEILNIIIGGIL